MKMFLPILLLALAHCTTSLTLPKITQKPVNVSAVLGESVKFECEATGNPTPDILIIKKNSGYSLPEANGVNKLGGSDTVSVFKTLNNVRPADSGWYECVASNSMGYVISEAYLEVFGDPCDKMKCSARKECHVTDYRAGLAECRCKECDSQTYNPVCGSDCETYLNSCEMRKSSCQSGLALTLLHKGECRVEEAQLKITGATDLIEGDKMVLTCEASGFPEPTAFRWAKLMRNGKQKVVGTGRTYVVGSAGLTDAGEYRCIAQQCMNRIKSELTRVEVDSPSVHDPTIKTCRIFGDPHIQTFDGKNFDFMGRCNYIMSVDCAANKWMVIGQFTKCGKGVTCLEQITVYHGSMVPLTLARGWIVGQNGEKFRLRKDVPTTIQDAKVVYTGLNVKVDLPGVSILWDGFWGIQISVSDEAKTCGLCGDNDGDSTNDVTVGRYGYTGGDINTFGQSWAMWNPAWCGIEEVRGGADNSTCESGDMEEVESQCDAILGSEVFAECTAAMGDDTLFRDSCVLDGCKTKVERYEGSSVCAVTHSIAQICEVNGFRIPSNYLELVGCGPDEEFLEDVYNSGCPLDGNPPFLDQ